MRTSFDLRACEEAAEAVWKGNGPAYPALADPALAVLGDAYEDAGDGPRAAACRWIREQNIWPTHYPCERPPAWCVWKDTVARYSFPAAIFEAMRAKCARPYVHCGLDFPTLPALLRVLGEALEER